MFKTSSPLRTPCEVLREINDLCQSNSNKDKLIRKKLYEVQKMAKRITKKIEYLEKQDWNKWWEKIDNWREIGEKRITDKYRTHKDQ